MTTNTVPGILVATTYKDGEFNCGYSAYANVSIGAPTVYLPDTVESVVCGSCLYVNVAASYSLTYSGLELVETYSIFGAGYAFRVTAAAGETVTITAVYND